MMEERGTDEERELADWRAEWTRLGGRAELAAELEARARRADWRFRAYRVGNGLAVAFALATTAALVVRERGAPLSVALCVAMAGYAGVLAMRLSHEGGPAPGATVASFVAASRARIERDLRLTRFADRVALVLGCGFSAWWVAAAVGPHSLWHLAPVGALGGLAPFALVVAFAVIRGRRKRRRLEAEREHLEALVAERTLA